MSRRLRRCRSSSGADGSIRRSISWAAISDAFAAFLVRTTGRGSAWGVQRHQDGFALIADDVSRFVVIPFVRFHNVENYRLDFPGGVTPRAGKAFK